MLSKITMVLAFAMAIITVVPASVGTSFTDRATPVGPGASLRGWLLLPKWYLVLSWIPFMPMGGGHLLKCDQLPSEGS